MRAQQIDKTVNKHRLLPAITPLFQLASVLLVSTSCAGNRLAQVIPEEARGFLWFSTPVRSYQTWEGTLKSGRYEVPVSFIVTADRRIYSTGSGMNIEVGTGRLISESAASTPDTSAARASVSFFGFNLVARVEDDGTLTGFGFGVCGLGGPSIALCGDWSAKATGSIDPHAGTMNGRCILPERGTSVSLGPSDLTWTAERVWDLPPEQ
jgi:hypothetical protein